MAKARARGEVARKFIIENVQNHARDIIAYVAQQLAVSRQAVHRHVQQLIEQGVLSQTGQTRNKAYRLVAQVNWRKEYRLDGIISEDQVWRIDVAPSLRQLPENVINIWHYGFTEMFNNAIDHSEGSLIAVTFSKTAADATISLQDNGIGIFKKIQEALGLLDERHAVLELAKGKFTTDPKNHSGEGIFFASRMFESFRILSGGVFFSHGSEQREDWIFEEHNATPGTNVTMRLENHISRTTKKTFDKFTTDDNYGFTKTIVPVKLTQYGDDDLVSRSQAKRLLTRIDRFKVVVFDFIGVASIGQAFADEVFRVFANDHPNIEIVAANTGPDVKKMISRARTHDSAHDQKPLIFKRSAE
jgi:DNA-binding Lrp family transcriptional regulator